MRCRYATTPRNGVGVCVWAAKCWSLNCSPLQTLSEVESNGHRQSRRAIVGRRRHIRSLCFRYNTGQCLWLLPPCTRLPWGQACSVARRKSNPRSRAPTTMRTWCPARRRSSSSRSFRFYFCSSHGSRTHLSALKGRDPQADRRTSRVVFCAHLAQWVGRRSNPRLLVFSQADPTSRGARRLSYRPHCVLVIVVIPHDQQKSPMSL